MGKAETFWANFPCELCFSTQVTHEFCWTVQDVLPDDPDDSDACDSFPSSPVHLLLLSARQFHGNAQLLIKAGRHTQVSWHTGLAHGAVGKWTDGLQRGHRVWLAGLRRVLPFSAPQRDGQRLLDGSEERHRPGFWAAQRHYRMLLPGEHPEKSLITELHLDVWFNYCIRYRFQWVGEDQC